MFIGHFALGFAAHAVAEAQIAGRRYETNLIYYILTPGAEARPVELIARWDGLRSFGNVLATSPLRSKSEVLRYTAALAYHLPAGLRLKVSGELYDFSDFDDEIAIHTGIAGPF